MPGPPPCWARTSTSHDTVHGGWRRESRVRVGRCLRLERRRMGRRRETHIAPTASDPAPFRPVVRVERREGRWRRTARQSHLPALYRDSLSPRWARRRNPLPAIRQPCTPTRAPHPALKTRKLHHVRTHPLAHCPLRRQIRRLRTTCNPQCSSTEASSLPVPRTGHPGVALRPLNLEINLAPSQLRPSLFAQMCRRAGKRADPPCGRWRRHHALLPPPTPLYPPPFDKTSPCCIIRLIVISL
mmetsp:Transcript_15599/g.37235  ORF Transcript_15599/g.37235 Transcript_15599/m.37235 type:complete len:242 (-) Transcript_15599:23-748(-)